MAKKHLNRPALRAFDVWRWIANGVLEIVPVRKTPVFYLLSGRHVRQTWFHQTDKKAVIKETAVTYIRKGTFLVPIWISVPEWEIEHLKSLNLDLTMAGIALFGRIHRRLCYMQVEDLDHTERQQDHVLDTYIGVARIKTVDFFELFNEFVRRERIVGKVQVRYAGVYTLGFQIRGRLQRLSKSIPTIVANAPILKGKGTAEQQEKSKETIIVYLGKLSKEFRTLSMRPIGVRLGRAARSFEKAIEHLHAGRRALANQRIASGLRNIPYPVIAPP